MDRSEASRNILEACGPVSNSSLCSYSCANSHRQARRSRRHPHRWWKSPCCAPAPASGRCVPLRRRVLAMSIFQVFDQKFITILCVYLSTAYRQLDKRPNRAERWYHHFDANVEFSDAQVTTLHNRREANNAAGRRADARRRERRQLLAAQGDAGNDGAGADAGAGAADAPAQAVINTPPANHAPNIPLPSPGQHHVWNNMVIDIDDEDSEEVRTWVSKVGNCAQILF